MFTWASIFVYLDEYLCLPRLKCLFTSTNMIVSLREYVYFTSVNMFTSANMFVYLGEYAHKAEYSYIGAELTKKIKSMLIKIN